jgi:hypothetical protein
MAVFSPIGACGCSPRRKPGLDGTKKARYQGKIGRSRLVAFDFALKRSVSGPGNTFTDNREKQKIRGKICAV